MTKKYTEFPAATSVAESDIIPCVVLSGPTTNKITVANLFTSRTLVTPILGAASGTSLALSGAISLGPATVSTTGYVKMAFNSGEVPFWFVRSGGTDYQVLAIVGGDVVLSGAAFGTNIDGSLLRLKVAGTTTLAVEAASVASVVPIIGSGAPYGAHGKVAIATAGSFAVAASDYVYNHIRLTGGTAGTVTFPAPASDAASYSKFVGNASLVTKTISTGAGATVALLNSTGATIEFDSSVGCSLRSAAVAYT